MVDVKPLDDDKFERIRKIYVDSFPEKIQTLKSCWASLMASREFEKPLKQLRLEAHRISGSSGSHNFDDIHLLASRLDSNIVAALAEQSAWISNKELIGNQVQALVDLLQHQLLNYSSGKNNNSHNNDHSHGYGDNEEGTTRLDSLQLSHRELLIFLVSHRPAELSLLSSLLAGRGFTVLSFGNMERAQNTAKSLAPSIVVLDLGDAEQIDLQTISKHEFQSGDSQPPAYIVTSRRDDAVIRKLAIKFGVEAFFATPINTHNFSSTLDVILETRSDNGFRVLLIARQDAPVANIEQALENEDISCRTIHAVESITDQLVNFKPDLVLITYHKGRDYWANSAGMIRLHESYFNIPVIFLLENECAESKLEALQVGADDCICGYQLEAEQIQILKQRIMRFRRANHLITTDSLTGTLNRDAFFDRANEELSLAVRRKENICLAMIDVDYFKQINDAYGHVAGDYVLRHISECLNNRLRRSDLVGRYAGDEFLVLLPDTDLENACLVLNMIRKNLTSQNISINDLEVQVSISLGLIAVKPTEVINIETFIIEADKKLYEAKVAGRNMLMASMMQSLKTGIKK